MVFEMRFHNVLFEVAGSKARACVTAALFKNPVKEWTGRQLALAAGVSAPQTNSALAALKEQGIVVSTRVGPAMLWRVNERHYLSQWISPFCNMERRLPAFLAQQIGEKIGFGGISKIVLFGSVARGEERPTSDIDVLVLVEKDSFKQSVREKMLELSLEFSLVLGNPLSPVILTRKKFEDKKKKPLYANIAKEGLVVYDKVVDWNANEAG